VLAVHLIISIWHSGSPSKTFLEGAISFMGISVAIAAVGAARHPSVSVNFTTGRIKIGRRVSRLADIDGAQYRRTGQFLNPTVALSLRAGRGRYGVVYLRLAAASITETGCRGRLISLIERSSLPEALPLQRAGAATPLPDATIELTKPAALALVLSNECVQGGRNGSAP